MLLLTALLAHGGELTADATGRFVSTQTPTEVESLVADAMERALAPIPWAFRGLARSALAPHATTCPAYTIAVTATTFTVQCDGRKQFTWTLGERGPFTTDSGETVQRSVTASGRSITLAFTGDSGGRTWTYTFPEAGGLSLRQEVTSPRLEVPLTYTLPFRKE